MSIKNPNEIMCNDMTIEEIMAIEAVHYYIQIGDALLESDSCKISFTKDKADDLFLQAWDGLNHMRDTGTREEKSDALKCLRCFKVHPLRIH